MKPDPLTPEERAFFDAYDADWQRYVALRGKIENARDEEFDRAEEDAEKKRKGHVSS